MTFSPYQEVCDCGHDRATHFNKSEACLGVRCDCRSYRDHLAPKTPVVPSTLRSPTLRVLEAGARVRVIDYYSSLYLVEGAVTAVVEISAKRHAKVDFDGMGEHWLQECQLQVL